MTRTDWCLPGPGGYCSPPHNPVIQSVAQSSCFPPPPLLCCCSHRVRRGPGRTLPFLLVCRVLRFGPYAKQICQDPDPCILDMLLQQCLGSCGIALGERPQYCFVLVGRSFVPFGIRGIPVLKERLLTSQAGQQSDEKAV